MRLHLVQIANATTRRIAIVEEPHLRQLSGPDSIYALAQQSLTSNTPLTQLVESLATTDLLDYTIIGSNKSPWHLLPPIDIPDNPSRLILSGTGLTHLGSAKERQNMHLTETPKQDVPLTDSMRIFQWGIERGRPAPGAIGVAPEWFYKGTGANLQPPFAPLTVPAFAEDGGEEAEIAGIYLIAPDGTPVRIGLAQANEFSDHKFEKRNYLNLAGSKLRPSSLGPELVVGADFHDIPGEVRIERGGEIIWSRPIATGEANMCHSLANLEHHHFKFPAHRRPGDVHVHFFGAQVLSFGDQITLEDGDWMQVRYEGFGRPLRNPIQIEPKSADRLIEVRPLT